MDIEISRADYEHGGRYTLLAGGAPIGELDHADRDGVRTFTHTGVRKGHEGEGLAAKLVRRGLDDARTDGVRVVAECPYVKRFVEQHPDDADLLA
ncbi:MAG: N-acetyltransferase [Actinobacteria bacterium]|nr:N-acetyltransferase [Actinomycetota bacterium]